MRSLLSPLFICLTTGCFCQIDLKEGLKLHYTFSGKVEDVSGNRNNPTSENVKLTEDRFGNPNSAAHFNGKKTCITIPDARNLRMDDQISLCVWIKPTGFYDGPCHGNAILIKGRVHGSTTYILFFGDNLYTEGKHCSNKKADLLHQNFYGAGMTGAAYEPYVKTSEWTSVIYTFDGTTANIYVGGTLAKSQVLTITPYFTNLGDLTIGKQNYPGYEYWLDADLDDIRIYDRAINQDEINAIAEVKTPLENK